MDHGLSPIPEPEPSQHVCDVRLLGALLARHRAVEIDAAYAAYNRLPLDVRDEWGDLASFPRGRRRVVSASGAGRRLVV